MNRHFILFALAFAAALSGFAKTFDVDISTGRPAASNEAYYHGETIEFRAVRGRSVVTNVEYSCVYYQTNGMDSVWWHTDGLVFHPTNDVGAANYRFFLEGRDDLGRDWHANGLLRLLPSPGFTPNEIELPVARLDFANIEVANDPWTEAIESNRVEIATVRVGVASNSAAIATNSDAIAEIAGTTSTLSDSISTLSTNVYTKAETDAAIAAATPAETDPVWEAEKSGYATAAGLAALEAEARPAINGYSRLYSFVSGATNANIVVTNFPMTAEEDAGRVHFDPSDPDLDISTVPASLRIEDASSGTNRVVVDTRDFVVWYWAQKIGGAIAEAVSTAVDTCRAWVNFTASGLENPIPDTLVIDVPNIWLMAGKTFEKHVAGSNACWVIRSNGVTMPISDNAQSAGGFLELTDAFGQPYIRFNKTESYFVDPVADGIEYDSSTGAWLVTYSTDNRPKGGANAVIVGSTTYPGKAVLKAEDDADCPATITWTGSSGNWVMHAVPKPIDGAVPKSMFFGAVVEVQGQDYIEYLRPMSIPHLLVDGVKIAPVVPASHPTGTTITWKVVE